LLYLKNKVMMKKRTLNTPAKLNAYKARRQSTDGATLTKQFKGEYSQSHIVNVLAGRRRNPSIVEAAYNLAITRTKNSVLAKAKA
jgi:hypothetical protein